MALNVFREQWKVGSLDMHVDEPFFGFTYDMEYLHSKAAQPLSLSLPLAPSRYTGKQTQPYFEGLLPESQAREAIARRLGIPRNSSVKLLVALGRDCAGDVSIIDEGEEPGYDSASNRNPSYSLLEGGLSRIAENPLEEVTGLVEDTRLSLAGGQEKISLYHDPDASMKEGWYKSAPGSPSTHILKPGILEAYYPCITLNEFLCLRAAAACGVKVVHVDIAFLDNPVLIIERYDRQFNGAMVDGFQVVRRIHQEDCCQACGVIPDFKYEHDGGPGFKQIRDLLTMYSKSPVEDISMLVKWALFNYLVGNCDAHAKNLSLLHNGDGTISLAPTYDIKSTAVYNSRFGTKLSRGMGMRIGMHENIDKVNAQDLILFAQEIRMRPQQIKSMGEEIIRKLSPAFSTACLVAQREGFKEAGDMADRIMNGCNQRATILLS